MRYFHILTQQSDLAHSTFNSLQSLSSQTILQTFSLVSFRLPALQWLFMAAFVFYYKEKFQRVYNPKSELAAWPVSVYMFQQKQYREHESVCVCV